MARGKKTDEQTTELIIELYLAGESFGSISKKAGVSKSVVSRIIKEFKNNDEDEPVEQERTQKRLLYIKDASEVVKGLFDVLKKRVRVLQRDEDTFDKLLEVVVHSELGDKERTAIIGMLRSLVCPKLTEITTALGTAYDKLERMEERGGTDDDGECGVVAISDVDELDEPKQS